MSTMNTTKRKLNELLNGIGTKITSHNNVTGVGFTSSTSSSSTPVKRRRLDAHISPKANGPSMQSSTNSDNRKPPASISEPTYAPWDRAAFLKRLQTFSRSVADWMPKPSSINEVEWAKRGWVCQKLERVRCCSCNVELLVKLKQKDDEGSKISEELDNDIEIALINKYADLIITSHKDDCLWKQRGCDDSIYRLPLRNTAVTLLVLQERYQELTERSANLPYLFNLRTPPNFDLDVVLSQLSKDFIVKSSREDISPMEVNKVAFILALFGWQEHTHDRLGKQLGSISCHACFRTLGMWLYKSKEVKEKGEESRATPFDGLDVVLEHRDYCPWKSTVSQTGGQPDGMIAAHTKAGWEIVLQILKNDHFMRTNLGRGDGNATQPQTPTDQTITNINEFGFEVDDQDAKSVRDEQDKARWARLRKVKSLFDPKGLKRIQTTAKQPG